MNKQECRIIPIAQNPVGQVQFCQECGQVSISLQFMTVRLEAAAFDALVSLICEADKQRAYFTSSLAHAVPHLERSGHSH